MKNKKLILLSLIAILVLVVAAGCGSGDNQATKSAPAATAAKPTSSMPNEDPMPIARDLERKLQDTGTMTKEGKWAEAKIIAAEALKTNDRLIVHVTDTRMKDSLKKSVSDVNDAVKASPADQKSAEAKVSAALEALKQATVQLQGHKH